MKRFLFLLLVLAFVSPAAAQVAYPQLQLAPTPSVSIQVAGSAATPAVSNQYTITITPPVGQFVYITGMEWNACADAVGGVVVTNLNFVTTGLGSSLPSEQISFPATASICYSGQWPSMVLSPLKSKTPGVAVTFVTPTGNAHIAYNQNVFYYFAP
jgi:hypothetical protein